MIKNKSDKILIQLSVDIIKELIDKYSKSVKSNVVDDKLIDDIYSFMFTTNEAIKYEDEQYKVFLSNMIEEYYNG